MSYKPSWHTKEDIMQDLVVMGQMTNIDEGYLVTGEKPPPPRHELEDDEMDLRFGGISNDGHTYQTEKPDLHGITQFLRMVSEDNSLPRELPDDEIIIVKPSIESNHCPKPGIKRNLKPKASINSSSSPKRDIKSKLDVTPGNNLNLKFSTKSKFDPKTDIKNNIDSKPAVKSNTDSKPIIKNNIDSKPGIKNNIDSKPAIKNNIDSKPAIKNNIDSKHAIKNNIDSKPAIKNNIDSKPAIKNNIDSKPNIKNNIDSKPAIKNNIDSTPALISYIDSTSAIINNVDSKPAIINNIDSKLTIKSNLDPTVAEFIPKSAQSSVVSYKSDNEKTNETSDIYVESDVKTIVSDVKMCTDVNLNKKLNRKEINDMSAKLRDKISDTLSADSPHLKKERNVAIANLMKLHSSKARPSTSTTELSTNTENTIKLLTPDYYKRSATFSPTGANTQRSTPNNELKKTRMDKSNSATPEPILNEPSTSSSSATPEQANDISLNSSMEESIKKVNNWFDKPDSPRPKAPTVCLGPISFKKKGPNHAKSPINDTEQKIIQSTAVYRPSQYANDLGKKYLERSKIKKAQAEGNWLPIGIEEELKARDEKIKKKQKANETTN